MLAISKGHAYVLKLSLQSVFREEYHYIILILHILHPSLSQQEEKIHNHKGIYFACDSL